ncbi:MAG TPA: cytochrome C oxidase subunit IV family protein [bacterium]|nr:cytochrome C oxidase subunit IV family protein [bacterium]
MEHGAAAEDIKKHVRTYVAVFVALAGLTVVTVGVSYMHLTMPIAVTVALSIATIKASLVAAYFMHLISERKLIFSILGITISFLIAMVFIIFFTDRGMMSHGMHS